MQIDSISLDHLAGMLVMGDDPTEFLWASAPFFWGRCRGTFGGGLGWPTTRSNKQDLHDGAVKEQTVHRS